ncbi:MAG: hypothetical protein KGJ07_07330 [Patescibacteria group bacterium]|nr:hypothetical protein [Patescibacteria group bacterium]MDE2591213.1 hypothetical protein [Patescibacteria group bacterium]
MQKELLSLTLPGGTTLSLPSQINTIVTKTANYAYGANIIEWALYLAFTGATITALAFLMYGGWKWITSTGDAKNLETAHNIILYSAVGLGVVLLSAAFVNAAAAVFCVPLIGWIPPSCSR